jgi:hypothetical protein
MAVMTLDSAGLVNDTIKSAKAGVVPALIGALGAGAGLYVLTIFFAPASIPMSVLGIVLGARSRHIEAVVLGGLGVVCAIVGLLHSQAYWLVFAVLAGAVTGG